MFRMDTLKINLLALQEEPFEATYTLGDEYFGGLEETAIRKGEINVEVTLEKVALNEYALHLSVAGVVIVPCDRCLDDMEQPVNLDSTYKVKLGVEESADDDVIMVDENEGVLSIAWLIYETVALAVPIKHVHAPGKCNDAMTQKLKELSATRSGDGEGERAIDPRWAELEKLKH